MKQVLVFYIVFVSFFTTSCAFESTSHFRRATKTMDTIAILPTVFNLTGYNDQKEKIHNDTAICGKLHRVLVSELNAVLGKKYALPESCKFRVISDTLTKSLAKDLRYVNRSLNFQDTFSFFNHVLDTVNAMKHRYVLIHYLGGTYKSLSNIRRDNTVAVAASVAVSLVLMSPAAIAPRKSHVELQSVLYDTRDLKVLYHKMTGYDESVYNSALFREVVKRSARKLYYR